MTKVTCPKLVEMTSNLLDIDINPEALFHDWESHHKSLENYLKPQKTY